jgi:hypothetical protein
MNKILVVAATLLLLSSCKEKSGDYKKLTNDPILYCKTVKELNNVVLSNNFPPMIAGRIYAYANIAAYECIAAGDKRFQSLAGQIKGLEVLPGYDTAHVDFQFASLLAFCKLSDALTFPAESFSEYISFLKNAADSTGMPSSVMKASINFADSTAAHILRWGKKDNYAQTRSASRYTVTEQEGRWVPTPPMYAQGIEPHWMEIRTLVMDSASQFKPVPPPVFDIKNKNSIYYKAMLRVKQIGDSLTAEQKHIADFWDDNPFKMNVSGHVMFATKKFSPPGHWMNIVGIAAQKSNADFATVVCAYTQTSIAMFDAFISCWDEKYRSNYVRPETIIDKYISPEWQPYIQTPPFPSYTSGHSTISAAAAETMTNVFGDNLQFTDTSLLEFGIANREIKSFRQAAQEASISRVYGGIHYPFDCDNGAVAGKKLGEFIVQKLKMKK